MKLWRDGKIYDQLAITNSLKTGGDPQLLQISTRPIPRIGEQVRVEMGGVVRVKDVQYDFVNSEVHVFLK
jgi:hypothetical protein